MNHHLSSTKNTEPEGTLTDRTEDMTPPFERFNQEAISSGSEGQDNLSSHSISTSEENRKTNLPISDSPIFEETTISSESIEEIDPNKPNSSPSMRPTMMISLDLTRKSSSTLNNDSAMFNLLERTLGHEVALAIADRFHLKL